MGTKPCATLPWTHDTEKLDAARSPSPELLVVHESEKQSPLLRQPSTETERGSTNCGDSTVFCTVSTIRHLSTTMSKNACGIFTVFCTVWTTSCLASQRTRQPCPRTRAETSRISALSGPSPAPVNAQQRARKQRRRTARWKLQLLHSLHCAYTPLKHNWKLEHSVEERKLRHLHVLVGMQELELQNNRDVHNRSTMRTAHLVAPKKG